MIDPTRRPGKPVLLLVHGWGMHPACWGGFREQLDETFAVQALALPGHGGTDLGRGWSVDALAQRWTEHWPGAHWLGWSLGAQVALAAASQSPERVGRLVLLGATPKFVADADWPHAMAPGTFKAFQADCATDPDTTLQRFLGLQVQGSDAARATLRALRAAHDAGPAPGSEALLDGLRVLGDTDLREALHAIDAPTLWITGEADSLAPPAAARAAAGAQRRGRVSCLPGAGHAPFLSHPEPLLDQVRQWLLPDTP